MKVAVRLSLDLLRKKKREKVLIEDLSNRSTEDEKHPDDSLLKAVSKLPEKYRRVIVLYYFGDETVEEIARTLSLSITAVKKRLQRGRDLIRQELEAQNGNNR